MIEADHNAVPFYLMLGAEKVGEKRVLRAAGQNLSDPMDRNLIDRQSGHLPALALFAAQMQKPPPFGRGFLA